MDIPRLAYRPEPEKVTTKVVYVLEADHGDARTQLPERTGTTISRSEGLGTIVGSGPSHTLIHQVG